MNDEYPVKAAVEIAVDESGEVLWVERYIFKRIHGPGETFVRDSKTYEVVVSKITYGSHGGALVEHVCKAASAESGSALLKQRQGGSMSPARRFTRCPPANGKHT